ncbi:hypothetical protein [Micromonospora sp. NPDC005172]|uniref:hypothetical protein n=1 Tax=Micromonospora sp. NPDC005172 TaxID=3156867 RepID=UPI0033A27AB8
MSADRWKGHVDGILYGVQFDRSLDDAVVTRVAEGVAGGLYPGDRAETRDAIDQALLHEGPLDDQAGTPHGEDEIRAFLGRLSAALASGPSPS